jgi:hypothetical protein
LTVRQEGKRQVNRPLDYYNLDMIPHSQAGAWERENIYEEGEPDEQATCKNFLHAYQADTKDSA